MKMDNILHFNAFMITSVTQIVQKNMVNTVTLLANVS